MKWMYVIRVYYDIFDIENEEGILFGSFIGSLKINPLPQILMILQLFKYIEIDIHN